MDPGEQTLLAAIGHEWLAANVLLDASVVEGGVCAEHIRRAWRSICVVVSMRSDTPFDETTDPVTFLADAVPELVSGRDVGSELAQLFSEPSPNALLLRSQIDLLESWMPTLGVPVPTRPRWRFDAIVWRRRAVQVMIAAVLGVALYHALAPSPRWRVEFHGGADLNDPLVVIEDVQGPNHDWGLEAPRRGVPRDDLSIRWSACVTIEEDQILDFELASDDGSRLFVDDDLVIDNWRQHGVEAVSATVAVTAGRHAIRVEYFDGAANALIRLTGSLDTLPLEPPSAQGCEETP